MSRHPYDPSRLDPDRTISDVGLYILVTSAVVLVLAAIGGVVAEWL